MSVIEQVLRESRWSLSAVGLWPLPAPWRIHVLSSCEKELERKVVSQLDLIKNNDHSSNNHYSPHSASAAAASSTPPQLKQSDSEFWNELEGNDDDNGGATKREDSRVNNNLDEYFDEIDQRAKEKQQNPHAKELSSLTMEFSL